MQQATIRIGIVGAGRNTREKHIPLLQAIDGVSVSAIANRSVESAQAAAAPFGIRCATDHWESLIEDPDLDAICIGTWPDMHAPVTLAALDAGKHVLCEARMASNAAEAHAMLAAAEASPALITQLVPSPFTLRIDDMVIQLLDEGAIGPLLSVDVRHCTGAFCHPAAPLTWRQDGRVSGLNALTLGIWYEAMMRWTGPATRVSAMTTVSVPLRKDESGILREVTVPDHIDIAGRLANGASLNMQFSAVSGLSPQCEVRMHGTEGTLRVQGSPARLFIGRPGDQAFVPVPIPEPAPGWRVEEEFVEAVRGQSPVRRTTFADGVRYMEFTEAVHRSAAQGCAIELPLPVRAS